MTHRKRAEDTVAHGLAGDEARPSIDLDGDWDFIPDPEGRLDVFPQGRGHLTITTLRLAPENGPAATVLLEALFDYVAKPETARPR